MLAECFPNKTGLGEEANRNATPDSTAEVNRNGVDGIVNLELDEKRAPEDVRPSSDDADDERGPGRDNGAPGSDAHEAAKGTVHAHGDVVHGLSGLPAGHEHVGEHGGHGTRGGGDRGRDGAQGGDVARGGGRDGEGGTGVEAVPSDPEDERAENLEGDGMGGEGVRLGELVTVGVVETSCVTDPRVESGER